MNLAVLASGEGTNFQAIAEAARQGRLGPAHLQVLISDNPDARALERAKALGVPSRLVSPAAYPTPGAHDQALLQALEEARIGLVALAGYMRILSPAIVRAFHGRLINIHPALLPAFPGAHAVRDALRHGAQTTGVTVHFVDEGVDTGPIIAQEAVPVRPDDTEATLAARIHTVEHRLYPEVIRRIAEGAIRLEGRRVVTTTTGATGAAAATGPR